jgi:hypothetical protein
MSGAGNDDQTAPAQHDLREYDHSTTHFRRRFLITGIDPPA